MRSYGEALGAPGPIIFDRGIPDVIGYLRLCGLPVPHTALRAAEQRRYARRVFIAPPWLAIFEQDAERKQTLAEAEPPSTLWSMPIRAWAMSSSPFHSHRWASERGSFESRSPSCPVSRSIPRRPRRHIGRSLGLVRLMRQRPSHFSFFQTTPLISPKASMRSIVV